MKTIFKKGDKVFDHQYEWGEVVLVDVRNNEVLVEFNNCSQWYTQEGSQDSNIRRPTLSFTEYTLEGFSQERPIDYNDYIGKWGVFWDDADEKHRTIRMLKAFKDGKFHTHYGSWYQNFKPLTDEQMKILEL